MEQQIAPLLEKLAAKLGTTAEHLWGVLVKQAPIDGTVELVGAILMFIGTFILIKKLPKIINYIEEKDNEGLTIVSVFGGVLGGVAIVTYAILFLATLSTLIAAFFNPEYWALQHILSLLKNK